MTKEEFKYVVKIDDEQLESIMLLDGTSEPADGDWIHIAAKWYGDLYKYIIRQEARQ